MEPAGPVGMELAGLFGRIVAVGNLAVIPALNQPDDLAGPQIDGGNHVHIDDLPVTIYYLEPNTNHKA
jgi:hypothetical protein